MEKFDGDFDRIERGRKTPAEIPFSTGECSIIWKPLKSGRHLPHLLLSNLNDN